MSMVYEKLCSARIKDPQWQPSIFIDIPVPQCISTFIHDCVDIKQPNKTNIVPLMARPSEVLKVILAKELRYPPGASFCFDGYYGVEAQDKSVSHIIDTNVNNNGSVLEKGRLYSRKGATTLFKIMC